MQNVPARGDVGTVPEACGTGMTHRGLSYQNHIRFRRVDGLHLKLPRSAVPIQRVARGC